MSHSFSGMRISRRHLLKLIGVAPVGALLAGCVAPTSAPSESGAGAAPAAATEAVVAAPAAEAPTLTVWADTVFVPPMQEMSKGFTEQYGVEMAFQPMGFGEILTQFQQAGPAGEGPDIIDWNVDWLDPLLRAGLVAPIEFGDKLENFDPRAVHAWSNEGKMYSLPLCMESYGMYRNPDLLDQRLESWYDLESVYGTLKDKVEFPILFENQSYVNYGLLTAFGGYLFGKNADGTYNNQDVGLDNEGAIKFANWLDSMVKQGIFVPGQDFTTVQTLYSDGKAALFPSGPWHLQTFNKVGISYVIDMLPEADKEANPFLSVRAFGLNKLGDQLALASTYLTEYMAGAEPQKIFADITAKESAWIPVKNEQDDPVIRQQIDAGKNATPIPSVPGVMAYWGSLTAATQLILNQEENPEETMKNLAVKLREAVKAAAA